jgi:ribosomal protein L37AE/L43A
LFSRFRAFCESRYDWSGAGVPDALTAEAEAAQREREKEKKRRAKQRKAEAAQQQPAPSVAMSTPAVITARVSSDEVATVRVSGKKTDAPSATVSKGKKEEPMCASCGQVLNKRTSVDVFDKKACGSECAVKLRRRIQAEAAEARLKGGSACK